MVRDGLTILRYLISPEESRIGRRDYWNSVFLAGISPLNRTCLEISKVLLVMILSTGMVTILAQL